MTELVVKVGKGMRVTHVVRGPSTLHPGKHVSICGRIIEKIDATETVNVWINRFDRCHYCLGKVRSRRPRPQAGAR
jgi:TolB-like protein